MVDQLKNIPQGSNAFPENYPTGSIPPRAISAQGGVENNVITLVNGIAKWMNVSGLLTTIGIITPSQGGTGLSSYNAGDLIVAVGSNTLSRIPAVGGKKALFSDVIGVPPVYRLILASDVHPGIFSPGNYSFAGSIIIAGTWQGGIISTTYTQAQIIDITGTINKITVGGTPTHPTVTISATYAGQTSIITVGIITTGVWNGTVITTSFTQAQVISVSGTANRITSTGGTTPVIDISAAYVGQTSITTLGTIITGIWNAGAVTSSSTVTATTEVRTPSLDTVGATDLIIQRNNVTYITLQSAQVLTAFPIFVNSILTPQLTLQNGASQLQILVSGGVVLFSANAGAGTFSFDSQFIVRTVSNPQIEFGYDTSNYIRFYVDATGIVTYTAAGASARHVFDNPVYINESGGPTSLKLFGVVSDGQYLKRVGINIVGDSITVDEVDGAYPSALGYAGI